MTLWIILAIVAAVAIYAIYIYNRLVSTRQMQRGGWSGIDVQLKRRADLVPNLVETVKGYAAHERDVFDEVDRAARPARAMRRPAMSAARARRKARCRSVSAELMAVAEAYPDLKASTNFLELQQRAQQSRERDPDGAALLQRRGAQSEYDG